MTLANEDTNSIPIDNANRAIQGNVAMTDNVNRAIQGNVAMQVTQPGGQLWKQSKLCHMLAKWWPNLQLMQVVTCCC